MQPVAIIPKMALLGTVGWGNFATFLRFFASHMILIHASHERQIGHGSEHYGSYF